MKLKVVFQEEALSDLDKIWLYSFETWSLEQADRYYQFIIKEIDFACRQPTSGKSLNELKEGYYSTKVKSHFIFYKFSTTELEVVRILHESMDILNRL